MYQSQVKALWNAERGNRVDLNDPAARRIRQVFVDDERRRHRRVVIVLATSVVALAAGNIIQGLLYLSLLKRLYQ